jgi:predicted MFS family arabinose efflux permease
VSYISDIAGPIISGLIFGGQQTETRTKLMLATMTIIGYIASAMMWFIKPVDPHTPAPASSPTSTVNNGTGIADIIPRFKLMMKTAVDKRMMFVNLYTVSFGVSLAWAWGWLPTLVPLPQIPWYLLCYGVTVYLAAWQSGSIYDKRGWFPLLASNLILAAISYVVTPISHTRGTLWPLVIPFGCFGAIEAIGTNLIQSTIMKNFDQASVGNALGVYRFLSGLSTGVTMLSGLSYAPLMLIAFTLLVVAAPLLAYNQIAYDNEKEQQRIEEEKSKQIDKARLNVGAAISVETPGAPMSSTPKPDDGLYQ